MTIMVPSLMEPPEDPQLGVLTGGNYSQIRAKPLARKMAGHP